MMRIVFTMAVLLCFSSCEFSWDEETIEGDFTTLDYDEVELKSFEGHPFMFYNVENLFDTIDDPKTRDEDFLPTSEKQWNTERYFTKVNNLAAVLSSASQKKPIFFGLAEIENRDVVRDLMQAGKLKNTRYGMVHYDSPDIRGIDVAFVYDQERFRVLDQKPIAVSMPGKRNYRTRDILYVKGMLKDSVELHIFVNHWPSRREGEMESEHKRVNAAKVLKQKTNQILKQDQNAHILIMGDFNDYPTNKSIRKTLDAGPVSDGKNFVNLMMPIHESGYGSYNYRGEWGTLDQFIVTPNLIDDKGGLQIKDNKAYLVDDDQFMHFYKNGDKTPDKTFSGSIYHGGYSDHLAVYGYLELQQ